MTIIFDQNPVRSALKCLRKKLSVLKFSIIGFAQVARTEVQSTNYKAVIVDGNFPNNKEIFLLHSANVWSAKRCIIQTYQKR